MACRTCVPNHISLHYVAKLYSKTELETFFQLNFSVFDIKGKCRIVWVFLTVCYISNFLNLCIKCQVLVEVFLIENLNNESIGSFTGAV